MSSDPAMILMNNQTPFDQEKLYALDQVVNAMYTGNQQQVKSLTYVLNIERTG